MSVIDISPEQVVADAAAIADRVYLELIGPTGILIEAMHARGIELAKKQLDRIETAVGLQDPECRSRWKPVIIQALVARMDEISPFLSTCTLQ